MNNMNMSNPMNNFSNQNYLWNNPNQFSFSSNPYNYNYLNNHNNNSISPTQQTSNNIIWVKGKENARSMQLPPNSTVILLDSEIGKFYIKTTDDIGLGKLRIFNYMEQPDINSDTQSNQNNLELDLSNYVTKNEFQQAIKEIRKHEQSLSAAEQTKQQQSSRKQQYKTINKQF